MASISESCINTLSSESSTPNKLQALTTLSWVTKAVTMRGQYSWSDKLAKVICELLGDSDRKIANQAAASIQIIMADHPTILHSQTHAITKVSLHFLFVDILRCFTNNDSFLSTWENF